MSRVLALLLLTAVYCLTLGSAKPLDVLGGLVAAGGSMLLLRGLLFTGPSDPPRALLRRIVFFPVMAAVVMREVVVGTWQVALVVLGIRPLERPGIVAVPLDERTETGVAASALSVTLSPGEVVVDVDWDRREMLIHALDASDPDGIRRRYRDFYRRYQRHVFP